MGAAAAAGRHRALSSAHGGAEDALAKHRANAAQCSAVQTWGATHLDDALYRQNFKTLQFGFWNLRLRRVANDRLHPGWQRLPRDVATLLRLVTLYLRLSRRYRQGERAAGTPETP